MLAWRLLHHHCSHLAATFEAVSSMTKASVGQSPKQTTLPASEFSPSTGRMSSRLKSLLIQLPRLLPPAEPLKEFVLFPKLPLEIQNKIWKVAASTPRVVKLFRPEYEVQPSILLTSREVRREGLRYYKTCIAKFPHYGGHKYGCFYLPKEHQKRIVCINFEVDQFVVPAPFFSPPPLCYLHPDDMGKIQTLTIDHTGYQPSGLSSVQSPPRGIVDLLSQVPNLRQLNILVRNWCAQVGVNQGIGQELWRKELDGRFRTHFELAMRDAGNTARLEIIFKDWNDSDTAPCSADAAGGFSWRYFSPLANENSYR
ncbi:uncharacterized protein K444DRAFT_626905 [Hyaloscypha bicolor E]|uniref:2EXR domain-containing protein n=1 Tax=Hyaloscypha bicolor E TaxID=1095630 RepID=A0A2J6TJH5_9HELO|nr:uncharacterized protein K444DRAFT_626905 [Hyaloscypha bicolor E]PMD63162.1 hypothetical protein K444DRAFT_626905 [Hyaloscypha bicolor E]